MNQQLQQFARQKLKEGLAQCTEAEQHIFKRMYSHANLDKPIDEVVEGIPADKLSWAMDQVDRTNAKRAAAPASAG